MSNKEYQEYREANKREEGVIESIFVGKEDHGIPTVQLMVSATRGGFQGFGGLALTDSKAMEGFQKSLCETFGVNNIQDIKGKKCYALRCFGFLNDTIEGLESVDTGKRFTITSWRNMMGYKSPNPLEQRRERLTNDIKWANRQIRECQAELSLLDSEYTDWEKR